MKKTKKIIIDDSVVEITAVPNNFVGNYIKMNIYIYLYFLKNFFTNINY